ncbi:putative Casein kinase I [Blattamonas nauphoetae]|uniref:non-specific serine/threonine protein kinase n=1 Tax=Blattamonas nauphoetae TaxID=2049346 RepID=A0ABQ9X6H2_9EUKA|nr:putative Casein kinase I [Blattamonas nauphoetae]
MTRKPVNTIPAMVANKYRIDLKQEVGKGSFGSIYKAIDKKTNLEYAAKFERRYSSTRLLESEMKILGHFKNTQGIPKIHYFGETNAYSVVIMDLLGKNLDSIFVAAKRTLPLRTICILGIQMISRMQTFHEKKFIHRDVKPENFLIGVGSNRNNVYMIDFGLSKKFIDSRTGDHISFRTGKELTGTPRYASINAHIGCETSRRDDLESIVYVLLYFLKGRLPWQGINAATDTKRYAKIGDIKLAISMEELCTGVPVAFATLLNYSRGLSFTSTPNYDYLKNVLYQELIRATGETHPVSYFEWLPETDNLFDSRELRTGTDAEGVQEEEQGNGSNRIQIGSRANQTIDTPTSLQFSQHGETESSNPQFDSTKTQDIRSPSRLHVDTNSQPAVHQPKLLSDESDSEDVPSINVKRLSTRRPLGKRAESSHGLKDRGDKGTTPTDPEKRAKPLLRVNSTKIGQNKVGTAPTHIKGESRLSKEPPIEGLNLNPAKKDGKGKMSLKRGPPSSQTSPRTVPAETLNIIPDSFLFPASTILSPQVGIPPLGPVEMVRSGLPSSSRHSTTSSVASPMQTDRTVTSTVSSADKTSPRTTHTPTNDPQPSPPEQPDKPTPKLHHSSFSSSRQFPSSAHHLSPSGPSATPVSPPSSFFRSPPPGQTIGVSQQTYSVRNLSRQNSSLGTEIGRTRSLNSSLSSRTAATPISQNDQPVLSFPSDSTNGSAPSKTVTLSLPFLSNGKPSRPTSHTRKNSRPRPTHSGLMNSSGTVNAQEAVERVGADGRT